jgi:hypothetical protein
MGDTESVTEEIVRYFDALRAEERAAIDALAERDRRFGEDVQAERAS